MVSLSDLMKIGLPLNRKERFYTGTVFPMIVCRDGFSFFNHFTAMIDGYNPQDIEVTPTSANIQFFTEYGLAESIFGSELERFLEPLKERDTPDILIFIQGVETILIALEAKMFLAPAPTSLQRQMLRQRLLLDYLKKPLAIDRIYHVALLPMQWLSVLQNFDFPIITWDDLYHQFANIIPGDYFLEVLRIALNKYDGLVSQRSGGQNSQRKISGLAIYDEFKDGSLTMRIMGRSGGINGRPIRQDFDSGAWRNQLYETSSVAELPNGNWFYIEDFVARIDDAYPTNPQ